MSNRNNKGSIILTTNLTFERWNEVFKDQVLTATIVDRLAHKSHIIDLTGESFRAKETIDWLNKNQVASRLIFT
ncbi:MAG: ATP-binding protein [Bacilli bacterium]